MVSNRKLASAVGAKTARACDNCIRKRARWYCAADDAFLCQSCDSSVHSANPLARRHERVRLKTASFKEFPNLESSISDPSWLHGFTRKARTPRSGNKHARNVKSMQERILNLVPEILSDENSNDDENEEQLLYQVPRYAETISLLSPQRLLQSDTSANNNIGSEYKTESYHDCNDDDMNRFHEMLPSEMDLAEFAADVESLLGKGLDEESFDMELGLGLLGVEKNSMDCSLFSHEKVIKDEVEVEFDMASSTSHHQEGVGIDSAGDSTFELKFDYDSSPVSITGGEEDNIARVGEVVMNKKSEDCLVGDGKKKSIFLNLEYEGVLNAWADRRSPWTTGDRPELDSDYCWPELSMENWGTTQAYGDRHRGIGDGGREARVLRYREKRRTRLFSKKIRYEVRKLNAEKRPRMKGRFVKRSNFTTPSFPY